MSEVLKSRVDILNQQQPELDWARGRDNSEIFFSGQYQLYASFQETLAPEEVQNVEDWLLAMQQWGEFNWEYIASGARAEMNLASYIDSQNEVASATTYLPGLEGEYSVSLVYELFLENLAEIVPGRAHSASQLSSYVETITYTGSTLSATSALIRMTQAQYTQLVGQYFESHSNEMELTAAVELELFQQSVHQVAQQYGVTDRYALQVIEYGALSMKELLKSGDLGQLMAPTYGETSLTKALAPKGEANFFTLTVDQFNKLIERFPLDVLIDAGILITPLYDQSNQLLGYSVVGTNLHTIRLTDIILVGPKAIEVETQVSGEQWPTIPSEALMYVGGSSFLLLLVLFLYYLHRPRTA